MKRRQQYITVKIAKPSRSYAPKKCKRCLEMYEPIRDTRLCDKCMEVINER